MNIVLDDYGVAQERRAEVRQVPRPPDARGDRALRSVRVRGYPTRRRTPHLNRGPGCYGRREREES